MNQFKKSKIIVLVSVLVLLSLSLLFLSSQTWFKKSNPLAPVNYLVSGVDSILSKPVNFISGSVREMNNLLETYDENKTLKATLSESQEMSTENDTLIAENESMRQALSLIKSYESKQTLASEVLVRNPNSWSASLSIDKGSHHGVSKEMLVLANGGLIGTLSDVDLSTSKVQLLTDETSTKNLAVKINLASGAIYGILTKYDAEENVFIVSQLNGNAKATEGSQVVTSDLSDEAASNVLVGTVSAVKKNGNTLDEELHVSPAADFSNIYTVVLVKN